MSKTPKADLTTSGFLDDGTRRKLAAGKDFP